MLVRKNDETFAVTAGSATVVPHGTPPAIDRMYVEVPGHPPVAANYVQQPSQELAVYRLQQNVPASELRNVARVTNGDSLAAIEPSSSPRTLLFPDHVRVTGTDQQGHLNLEDHNVHHHFEGLFEVNKSLNEGTLLFKDGQFAGVTLLGSRFLKEKSASLVLTADEVVEALKDVQLPKAMEAVNVAP